MNRSHPPCLLSRDSNIRWYQKRPPTSRPQKTTTWLFLFIPRRSLCRPTQPPPPPSYIQVLPAPPVLRPRLLHDLCPPNHRPLKHILDTLRRVLISVLSLRFPMTAKMAHIRRKNRSPTVYPRFIFLQWNPMMVRICLWLML